MSTAASQGVDVLAVLARKAGEARCAASLVREFAPGTERIAEAKAAAEEAEAVRAAVAAALAALESYVDDNDIGALLRTPKFLRGKAALARCKGPKS